MLSEFAVDQHGSPSERTRLVTIQLSGAVFQQLNRFDAVSFECLIIRRGIRSDQAPTSTVWIAVQANDSVVVQCDKSLR